MSTTDDQWDLEKKDESPKLLFEGKVVKEKNFLNFNFIEKDFKSTVSEKRSTQFLNKRFLLLKSVLQNHLSDNFLESTNGVTRPNVQWSNPVEWKKYCWLYFVRSGTYDPIPLKDNISAYKDSIQFQVTLREKGERKGEIEIGIWLDGVADKARIHALEKIKNNKSDFYKLLTNIPSSYFIGYNTHSQVPRKDEEEILKINDQIVETVIEILSKPNSELWISAYLSKEKAIQLDTDVVDRISDIFEKLVPLSEFLGKTKQQTGNYYLITSGSKQYDDIEGKKYVYPKHIGHTKRFVAGTNVVVQKEIDNQYYFIGSGKIKEIQTEAKKVQDNKTIIECTATYSQYQKFLDPKIRTKDIFKKLQEKAFPSGNPNSQFPAMLKITPYLYGKIVGEDLTFEEDEIDTMSNDDYDRALELKPNLILYGPPGTGKTYHANRIAEKIAGSIPILKEHTWKSLAILVLLENDGKPMNYHEIAKIALSKNLISTKGETPHETIAKDMRNDMEQKGKDSFFIKPEDGVYGLNIPTTFEKTAEIILLAENRLMHTDNITEIAINKKMIIQRDEPGVTPNRSMNQILSQDVKNNNLDSKFIHVGAGTYGLRSQITNTKKPLIYKVTFHPSYSYEDFVEGFRPNVDGGSDPYVLNAGIFKEICNEAKNDLENKYVLLIDEINRGNIPKIFGELITLIEKDKRNPENSLKLTYSKCDFFVPKNLIIIGTMNTADKSLVQMDEALRRRFVFEELMPEPELLEILNSPGKKYKDILVNINKKIIEGDNIKQFRDRQIGHSYFMEEPFGDKELRLVIKYQIIPLLQDYFYDDYDEIKRILGSKIIGPDNRPGKILDEGNESKLIQELRSHLNNKKETTDTAENLDEELN